MIYKNKFYNKIRDIESILPQDEKILQEFKSKIKQIEDEISKLEPVNDAFYINQIHALTKEYQWCFERLGLISYIDYIYNQLDFDEELVITFEHIIEKIEKEVNKPSNINNIEIYKKIEEYLHTTYKWCSYREDLRNIINTIAFEFEFNKELKQDFESQIKEIDAEMNKPENKTNEDFYLEHLMSLTQVLE